MKSNKKTTNEVPIREERSKSVETDRVKKNQGGVRGFRAQQVARLMEEFRERQRLKGLGNSE